jgi:hypothetical protein
LKNSNLKEQRKLLKGYGFTWYSALKILLFSIVFSSFGLSAFVLTSEYSFVKAKNEVVARIVNTYENIVKIYDGTQNGRRSYIAGKVIGHTNYKFPNAKTYGPKDLNLEGRPDLVKVKGQKLKLTENLYKVRFIDTK